MSPHSNLFDTSENAFDTSQMDDDGVEVEPPSLNAYGKRDLLQPSAAPRVKRQNLSSHANDDNFICDTCQATFKNAYSLKRHVASKHSPPSTFFCNAQGCHEFFTRKDTLLRHQRTQHGDGKFSCPQCEKAVRRDGMVEHQATKACQQNRIKTGYEAQERATLDPPTDDSQPYSNSEVETSVHHCDQNNVELPLQISTQTDDGKRIADVPAADGTLDRPDSTNASLDMYIHERSDRTAMEAAVSHSSPPFASLQIFASFEPILVPDSPRPIAIESALDITMLECDSRIEDMVHESIEEMVVEVDKRKDALKTAGFFAPKQATAAIETNYFHTNKPPYRFYRMSLGSQCALCELELGRSRESVFQHAKYHLQRQGQLDFKCPACGTLFAYELDLRLHFSKLELWSHCRGQPVEPNDSYDWIARASQTDDCLFVDLLRRWEFLQLLWYLRAVRKLLVKQNPVQITSQSVKTRPYIGCGAPKPLHTAPNSSVRYRRDYLSVASLTRMFNSAHLSDEGLKACGQPPTLLDSETRFGSLNAVGGMHSRMSISQLENAVLTGNLRDARAAIARGANVNCYLSDGNTPLYVACWTNRSYEFLRFLIRSGADVNAPDANHNTPLIILARQESNHENDVPVDQVLRGRRSSKSAISPRNINFESKSRLFQHWKHWVCCSCVGRHYLCSRRIDCIHLLLKHGAAIDKQNESGMTALMFATIQGDTNIVQVLLNHGASVDVKDIDGRDILHWSSQRLKRMR